MPRRILFLLFCLLSFSLNVFASDDLKFSLVLDKSEYKPDEPVNLSFKIENKGDKPVYVNKRFYLGSDKMPKESREIVLSVISPSKENFPCRYSYETGLPKSDDFILLAAGGEVVSEYKRDLRVYFDFAASGVYRLTGVYQNVCGSEIGLDVHKEKIVSEPVSFTFVKE